jgi:hypothetical protein
MIPAITLGSSLPANGAPCAPIELPVTPSAGKGAALVAGAVVVGSRSTHTGVYGVYAFDARRGWDTRGARGGRVRAYLSGLEDTDRRIKR